MVMRDPAGVASKLNFTWMGRWIVVDGNGPARGKTKRAGAGVPSLLEQHQHRPPPTGASLSANLILYGLEAQYEVVVNPK
jgi:hypothetical protein